MIKKSASKPASRAGTGFKGSERVCVLYGSEAMLHRERLDGLRVLLEASEGEVDVIRFDGGQVELADVLDEVRSFGLMQQHKIVVIENADDFVTAHRQALERYAQKPADQATLVLRCQTWRAKTKLNDYIVGGGGGVVECKTPTPAQAAAWLINRAGAVHGRKLDRVGAAALVERAGCELMRLDQELGKLAAATGQGGAITVGEIEQAVGRTSDEQAWVVQEEVLRALGEALSKGGAARGSDGACGRAIEKVHELVEVAGQPDILVAYFVADLVRRLLLARAVMDQGAGEQQIASRFRLFGPRKALFMRVVREMDTSAAAQLLDEVVELDRRSKSGLGKPVPNLERLLAGVCAIGG